MAKLTFPKPSGPITLDTYGNVTAPKIIEAVTRMVFKTEFFLTDTLFNSYSYMLFLLYHSNTISNPSLKLNRGLYPNRF